MTFMQRWYVRYGLALAIVLAAVLARAALVPAIGLNVPYVTIYPAMMIVAVVLGAGPGVLVTVAGILLAERHFMRPETGIVWDLPFAARSAIVLAASLYLGWIGQRLRAARARAETEAAAARAAGQALRESESRLNRAQAIAHLGSWELDLANNRLTWSDEVFRIFGLQPKEFGATYEAFLARVHPDDRAAVDAAYAGSVRENRDAYEIEHRVVRKDTGEIRFVHEKCEHSRDAAGRLTRSVGMVHDITDRKKAEAEIRRVNENLEQFAYIASHDLQEPLRTLSSFSQLLAKRYKGRLDQDADEFIGFIIDGAARMQNLIADLLEYSRAGKRRAALADVDCDQVLGNVLRSMAAAIEAAGGKVTHDPLPTIRAYESGIAQLLQNLIGNALKFRDPHRPVEVHVGARRVSGRRSLAGGQEAECKERDAGPASPPMTNDSMTKDPVTGDAWLFSVRDNGIGIDPQYHQRIFAIFQRLHPRDKYAGTGVGLSICKRIVENLGGQLWVESAPGRGSTFCFTVPAGEAGKG